MAPTIVDSTIRHHAFGLSLARETGLDVSDGRVLEIGFNEGCSPIALAKLGFEVHCVDNAYDLDDGPPAEIGFVAAKFGVAIATRISITSIRPRCSSIFPMSRPRCAKSGEY